MFFIDIKTVNTELFIMGKRKKLTDINSKIEKVKMNRKKKRISLYTFDMTIFNEKIKNQMKKISLIKTKLSDDEKYEKQYQEYLLTEFNTNCILFLTRILSDSKIFNSEFQNTKNIHKILMNVIKTLMLNEYELTLFSILLDNINIINKTKYSLDIILYLIGLQIKELTSDNISIILKHLKFENKEIEFENIYNTWKKELEDKTKLLTLKQINYKFKMLKRNFNPYCKFNFIDYNNIVDKILTMSLAYNNEGKMINEDNVIIINNVEKIKKKNIQINSNEMMKNKKFNKINNSINEIKNEQKILISSNEQEKEDNKITKSKQNKKNNNNLYHNSFDKSSFSIISNKNNNNDNNVIQNLNNKNNNNPYFKNFDINSKILKEDIKNSLFMPSKNSSQVSLNNIQQNKNNINLDYNYKILKKNCNQNLDFEDDNLKNLLNKSNQNFFQSGFSLNSLNNEYDIFNNDVYPIYKNEFELINLEENLQVKSKQNSKFILDGNKNKFNINNLNYFINEKENNLQSEGKKNFLKIYKSLKEKENIE